MFKDNLVAGIENLVDLLTSLHERIDKIEAALQRLAVEKTEKAEKPVLTFEQARQYLGTSKSHLYKLTSQKQIPHYKPEGKKLYFARAELEQWMLRNRVKTEEEIETEAATHIVRKRRG